MKREGIINLRKLRWSEAELKLKKELDMFYLKNFHRIKIVHGKGSGKLKQMVYEYLKKQPFISKFYEAEYFEGGAGVTIVEFK